MLRLWFAVAVSIAVAVAVGELGSVSSAPAAGKGRTVAASEGLIAFVRSTAGPPPDSHIFVVNAQGGDERQLTSGPEVDYDLDWSPDGRRLLFIRRLEQEGRDTLDLYVINADGTGLRQLTGSALAQEDLLREFDPAWSPDGRTIAYASSGVTDGKRRHGIYLMNADGSGKRRLDHLPSYTQPIEPAWSPDGRRLAFASAAGVIYVINSDGSEQRRLSHRNDDFPYNFYSPTWSPDGRRIGFVTMPGRYDSIYVVKAAGGSERLVTRHAYTEAGFVWRPDGGGVIYAREGRGGVYSMNLDGSGDHRLSRTPPRQDLLGGLSLSPNGRTIAFASDATGAGDIYLVNRDGSGQRRLTENGEIDGAARWSPTPSTP
jgi:TolB protein